MAGSAAPSGEPYLASVAGAINPEKSSTRQKIVTP